MLPTVSARLLPLVQTALSRLFDAFDFIGRMLSSEMLLPLGSSLDMEWARCSLRGGADGLAVQESAP